MADGIWNPTKYRQSIRPVVNSSSLVIRIQTDDGEAFLKAIHSELICPEVLGCEWLGTHLAKRFGLQTFQISRIPIRGGDNVRLKKQSRTILAKAGPAIVTKSETGKDIWTTKTIKSEILNPDDVNRLIVFDTWMRNCDRYLGTTGGSRRWDNPRNIFISENPDGTNVLKVIDHGYILTCGHPIDPGLRHKECEQKIYGLFPQFVPMISCRRVNEISKELSTVQTSMWDDLLSEIPHQWG